MWGSELTWFWCRVENYFVLVLGSKLNLFVGAQNSIDFQCKDRSSLGFGVGVKIDLGLV